MIEREGRGSQGMARRKEGRASEREGARRTVVKAHVAVDARVLMIATDQEDARRVPARTPQTCKPTTSGTCPWWVVAPVCSHTFR